MFRKGVCLPLLKKEFFMKKKLIFSLIGIVLFIIFNSCASISVGKTVASYEVKTNLNSEPKMEFIGFKADTALQVNKFFYEDKMMTPLDQWKTIQNTPKLKNIGTTLENNNIAENKAFAYFGIYSLQELELYKAAHRYVAFIEVTDNYYSMDEKGAARRVVSNVFAGIAGEAGMSCLIIGTEDSSALAPGAVLLGAGGLLLYNGVRPITTVTTFQGAYNIYIYDSLNKKIIYKEPVVVNSTDRWQGELNSDSAYNIVNTYYGELINNALLEAFDKLSVRLD